MAAAVQSPPQIERSPASEVERLPVELIVLRGVSWATYELLLADHEDRRAPRFAYDRGALEIVSPSFAHERVSNALGLLVQVVAEILKIDAVAAGTMTVRRADVERGFQPDASFYIPRAKLVRGKTEIDLQIDPPPDLVIEIDLTHSSLDKFPIYAEFAIPEVWRFRSGRVSIFVLEDKAYREVPKSVVLPIVTAEALTRFANDSATLTLERWLRSLRKWARAQIAAEQSPG